MTRPLRWHGPAAVALGLAPLAKLALELALGLLGANPVAEVLNRLGFWTITFLALSLLPTPLHDLLGLAWPQRIRRHLGLLAFAYAALHLGWYLAVDQGFDWPAVLADVEKRRFISVGLATFLLLVPLAATSTDGWVRRLGFRRWKALHRLAYLAALGAVVHFVWRVKVDLRKPLLFAAAFGLLFLARGAAWARSRLRAARPAPARAAAPVSPGDRAA